MRKAALKIKTFSFHPLIFLCAIIITTIFTWPLGGKLTTYYSDNGDYPVVGSFFRWNYDSLLTGRIFNQTDYFNGYQLYPQPYSFAFADNSFVPSLLFGVFFTVTHNLPLSTNLELFFTFIFSFLASFYVIRYFVKNTYAAIIGATIYTFNPFTFAHYPQHLNLLNKYFLPLVFFYTYQFFTKPNWKNIFLLLLFFTLNALTQIQFQVFSLVLIGITAFSLVIINLVKRNYLYIINLFKYGLLSVLFIPILLYFNMPYLQFSKLENAQRNITQNVFYSPRLIDWFSSNPESFLYGGWTKSLDGDRAPKDEQGIFNYEEHTYFLTLFPMLLFILALTVYRRASLSSFPKSFRKYLYWTLAVSLLLSFGPFFQGWNSTSGNLPLPFYYLFQVSDLFKGIRTPGRIIFLFYVPFSILCSYAVYRLIKNAKKLAPLMFVFCMSLLFIETYSIKDFNESSVVYGKESSVITNFVFLKDKNVLHLPVYFPNPGKASYYLNWSNITKEKLVNGNTSYWPLDQVSFYYKLNEKMDENTLKQLSALNINYVIFHKDLLGTQSNVYLQNTELYKPAIIYDANNLLILDLSKYSFNLSLCDSSKDLERKFQTLFSTQYLQTVNVIMLNNKSNCYLPNIYQKRYQSMTVTVNGLPQTVQYKMPLIIEPFQKIVLSDLNHDFEIK